MTAQGNIATSLLGFSCGIVLPQLVNNAGKDPAAWTRLAITVAIPLTLIGLCRMLFVKEENDTVKIVEEKVKTDLKDIFRMLGASSASSPCLETSCPTWAWPFITLTRCWET